MTKVQLGCVKVDIDNLNLALNLHDNRSLRVFSPYAQTVGTTGCRGASTAEAQIGVGQR